MSVLKRWLPVAAWSAVILLASSDLFSSQHTGAFLRDVLGVEIPPLLHMLLRKLGHLTGYGILGALALRAARVDFARPVLASFAIVLLVAGIDELHQSTIPSRGGSAWDVLLDVVGAAIAIGIMIRRRGQRP